MTEQEDALVRAIQIEHDAMCSGSHRSRWQQNSDNGRIKTIAERVFEDIENGLIRPEMTDQQIQGVVRSGIGSIILWWIGKEILYWVVLQLIRKLWPDRPIGMSA